MELLVDAKERVSNLSLQPMLWERSSCMAGVPQHYLGRLDDLWHPVWFLIQAQHWKATISPKRRSHNEHQSIWFWSVLSAQWEVHFQADLLVDNSYQMWPSIFIRILLLFFLSCHDLTLADFVFFFSICLAWSNIWIKPVTLFPLT